MSLDKDALFAQFETELKKQGAAFDDFDPQSDWAQILSDMGFTSLQRGVLLKRIHEQQGLVAASSSAPRSVLAKTVRINCRVLGTVPFAVVLKGAVPLKEEIIAQICEARQLPRHLHPGSLQSMDVLRGGTILASFDAVADGDELDFRWSDKLQEVSASDWTDTHLQQLKIHFKRVDDATALLAAFERAGHGPLPPPSPRVEHVLQLMEGASSDFLLDSYEKTIAAWRRMEGQAASATSSLAPMSLALPASGSAAPAAASPAPASSALAAADRTRLLHPLWKTLYMMTEKYPTVEALVDEFVSLLLRELMAGLDEADWLYVFPQLPLPLIFGTPPNETERRAIADRTILDVGSFYRMSVFEDKSVDQKRINSEPQLIAEAIAAHQANMQIKGEPATKRQRSAEADPATLDEPMLAVRVNGEQFYFYSVRVTEPLLQAMAAKTEAASPTDVLKLCRWPAGVVEGQGLSFFSADDRRVIVTVLDLMCQCSARAGRASRRRESGSTNPAQALTHKPAAGVGARAETKLQSGK